jgi:hypothetical protein
MGWEDVGWIRLVLNKVQLGAVVNMVMSFRVPYRPVAS